MKKFLYIISMFLFGLMVSCEENPSPFDIEASNDFSDVMFIGRYTGSEDKYAHYILPIGDEISFMDLSQNVVDHKWIISDKQYFVNGEYASGEDQNYLPFMLSGNPKSITDDRAHVVFAQAGDSIPVRLYNTFEYPVFYQGSEDSQTSSRSSYYDEKLGLHVFDTTWHFFVMDSLDVDLSIYKNGELLDTFLRGQDDEVGDSLNWPIIPLEVGDEIEVVIDTLYGSSILGTHRVVPTFNLKTSATVPDGTSKVTVATCPESATPARTQSIVYSKDFDSDEAAFSFGTIKLARASDKVLASVGHSMPSETETLSIPYRIKVLPPSASNTLRITKGLVKTYAPNVLQVQLNRAIVEGIALTTESSSFQDYDLAKDFVIDVTDSKGNKVVTEVDYVELIDNLTLQLTLKTGHAVYADDAVTISYKPDATRQLKDEYGCVLVAASGIVPPYFDPLFTIDSNDYGFEVAHSKGWPDGWWSSPGVTAGLEFYSGENSTNPLYLGSNCVAFKSALPTIGTYGIRRQVFPVVDASFKYYMSIDMKKTKDLIITGFTIGHTFANLAFKYSEIKDEFDAQPLDKWFTLEKTSDATLVATENEYVNMDFTAGSSGLLLMDNLHVEMLVKRSDYVTE